MQWDPAGESTWKQQNTVHRKKWQLWPTPLCEVVKRTLSGTRYRCSLTQQFQNVYVSHFCCFCHSLGSLSLLTFPHFKSFKAFWLRNENVVPCPQSDAFTAGTWDPDMWTSFPNSVPFIDSPPRFHPYSSPLTTGRFTCDWDLIKWGICFRHQVFLILTPTSSWSSRSLPPFSLNHSEDVH